MVVAQALASPVRYRNYYIPLRGSSRWLRRPTPTAQAICLLLSSSLAVVAGLTGASSLHLPRGGQGVVADDVIAVGSPGEAELPENRGSHALLLDDNDSKHSDLKASGLVAALEDARSAEAALSAENEILREELSRWQEAGLKVADREARAAQALHQRGQGQHRQQLQPRSPVALLSTEPASQGSQAQSFDEDYASTALDAAASSEAVASSLLETFVFNEGKAKLDAQSNALRLAIIFVAANTVAFIYVVCTNRQDDAAVEGTANTGVISRGPNRQRRVSFIDSLRENVGKMPLVGSTTAGPGLGQRSKVLEISDLRVSGLAPFLTETEGDELEPNCSTCVVLRLGDDSSASLGASAGAEPEQHQFQEFRTARARPGSTGLIRFSKSRFQFSVQSGANCSFAIFSTDASAQDREIAKLQVELQELAKMAKKSGGEYFSFDLSLKVRPDRPVPKVGGFPAPAPRLAFKLAEVKQKKAAARG